jgi:DNA-binding transcriptional regulator YhcF (GntR family)
MDINTFANAVNLTPDQVMEMFQQLIAEGFLHKVGTGYSLTEKGKNAIKITTQVPSDKAFSFYIAVDKPLGFSAHSLEEFYRLIKQVTSDSLDFHTYRGDFESWLRDVIGDHELALDFSEPKAAGLHGEELRKRLLAIIDFRYGINQLL